MLKLATSNCRYFVLKFSLVQNITGKVICLSGIEDFPGMIPWKEELLGFNMDLGRLLMPKTGLWIDGLTVRAMVRTSITGNDLYRSVSNLV